MDSLHEEESPPVDQAAPRARFSADEDQKILRLQQQNLDWNQISQQLGNRSARQCRERFQNYLDPELNTSNWTQEEDDLLILKENEMGKKWKKMMPYFKNRSNVNIKNRFATLQNRKKAADRALHSIDNSSNSHSENNSPATSNPTTRINLMANLAR
ncbi:Myb-like DNA-binding domain containing protein [Tritrichomonas foetus]|uniref:Myb-like DNA-binding domain containing protein n=1 Tax=Tritrichomonas foetus TaxID=1144522 RepID=A0A1J4K7R1_9EUKA|nr:Myb-like DNA-binding domain containing protein [Tritrichomonas foetus]|eukprot:OHT07521.1 Myb-like DNA-binding domain containing protein [Tritrichomonas foetus]